jgi:hypothetical protein
MKPELPQSVKICLWSYDTSKINPRLKGNRHLLIFNCLNYGTENAINWVQENFSEKQIKAVIKKSYASEWFAGRLKRWAEFYQVKPKWRTRSEYIMRNEKDFKPSQEMDNLWANGGHTIYNTLLKETQPRASARKR